MKASMILSVQQALIKMLMHYGRARIDAIKLLSKVIIHLRSCSKGKQGKSTGKDYDKSFQEFTVLNAASTSKSSRTTGRGRVSRCVARPTLPIQQKQAEVLL